jgi:RNA polymerase sigma-70 factor (ECF subfamily)
MNSDETLWIARARQGDDEAFNRLVEAYQRPVFSVCYRMLGDPAEAEDAAQETFIRAYTRLDSYDPGRKFSSWLLAIASHYCIDRLRRRRFNLVSWEDLPPWRWLPDPDPQPEEAALRHEAQRQVQGLLDQLPPDYRAAVVLRYWHDLSYEEIAEALDASLPAIKSRLFRARQMMAQAAEVEPRAASNKAAYKNSREALARTI